MLRVEGCVLVLLAAGRSRRFGGTRSKLDQDLHGLPLGLHVALALKDIPFKGRVAVVGDLDLPFDRHGFTVVRNEDRDLGMSSSVKVGAEHARAAGAASVVIALADMPLVTAAHVNRLFQASTDEHSIVSSSDGENLKPPALFGAGCFDSLMALRGDAGARPLLRNGRPVVAPSAELVDVDTAGELDLVRALICDSR